MNTVHWTVIIVLSLKRLSNGARFPLHIHRFVMNNELKLNLKIYSLRLTVRSKYEVRTAVNWPARFPDSFVGVSCLIVLVCFARFSTWKSATRLLARLIQCAAGWKVSKFEQTSSQTDTRCLTRRVNWKIVTGSSWYSVCVEWWPGSRRKIASINALAILHQIWMSILSMTIFASRSKRTGVGRTQATLLCQKRF